MEVDEKPTEDYSDVGGLDKQIQELIEAVVRPMTHVDLFKKLGITPPKGVLMYGPPGTGKDQLAMITACQVEGCTYFEIPEGFGSRKPLIWKVLFEMAVKMAPAVLFFNECEGVFTKGGSAQNE